MARKNTAVKVRAQYAGEVRDDERNRRRKRLAQRKTHRPAVAGVTKNERWS